MIAVDGNRTMFTVDEVAAMIRDGRALLLAGCEPLLDQLPRGRWIAGTTPYFMSAEEGGIVDETRIFAHVLPDVVDVAWQGLRDATALPGFAGDGAANGFTAVILPGGSPAAERFAVKGQEWPGLFDRPVVGWVSAVAVERLGVDSPKVYDGATGTKSATDAAILHASLPATHFAAVDIVTLFEPGDGPALTFDTAGFDTDAMRVDGVPMRLRDHVAAAGVDLRLPMIADYNGALVDVALTRRPDGGLQAFAPTFPDMTYRFAKPVDDLSGRLSRIATTGGPAPAFSCNCICNWQYGELEGKRTGTLTGPVTFGEIAYILLNQTAVYLTIDAV
ncbi:hypothetical protein ASG29_10820 [Sphingomonas sp. Leaf412]|uniref:DUF6976 family protein n=1 Tax=Sphingomonas sp. Leaf412 TaxID=1736370 RepID=UPI0006FA004B|nr:hypothetical protein [Sphingomonas sp. Leaf412]KQT32300.1 hypothetical protein ASG29_10820 [Sphingomonas sp. Leaf412]